MAFFNVWEQMLKILGLPWENTAPPPAAAMVLRVCK